MLDDSARSAPLVAYAPAAPPTAPPEAQRTLATARRLQAWLRGWVALFGSPLVIAGLFTAAMMVITVLQVRLYYQTRMPHYDSVGAYWNAFYVMNTALEQGVLAALEIATRNSLGWLGPLYAIPFSWIPRRTPAFLITMNFVLMGITQLAMHEWLRLNGYSARQRVVILALPFLPGAFYAWDGGLPDWRRDGHLNILLIGDLFLSLAYVQRPTAWRGVALGALVSLTQLARDNALSMVALAVFPALALAVRSAVRSRDWRWLWFIGWRPLVVFAALTTPYYVRTMEATIYRYTHLVWGPGEDRLASLARFWTSPADVLFGGTYTFNGKVETGVLTQQMLLAGLLVLGLCLVFRIVRLDVGGLKRRRSRVLIGSGVFMVVAVILYNTLGLGYGAQYHGMPFFPVLVGMTAIFAGLTDLFRMSATGYRPVIARLVLGVVLVAFIWGNAKRLELGQFDPVGNPSVRSAQDAAVEISRVAQRRAVAVLWFDLFGHPHLNYFLTQAGYPPAISAEKIDGPIRTGETPEQWLDRLHATTLERAGVVVVNEELHRYANPGADPGLFRDGAGFIQRLLDDPRLPVVYRFTVGPHRFVVLNNTTRLRP